MRRGAGASVHEQLGTTVLHQKLPAPPAGRQRQAVASGHTDGNQTAVTAGHERRHKAAFAAEREPERHVLDVARRHDVAVLAQPGGADSEPRIRRIRVCRGSIRSPAEAGPIEAGPIEAGPIEAGPIEVLRRLLGRRLSSSWHPRETSNRELASCRRYSPQGVPIQDMAGQDLAGAPRSVQPPVVVVLGDVMVDVVVRPLGPFNRGSDTVSRILVAPGGSATNLAVAMAGAGAQVHLVAVIGDDELGRTAVQALATTGVLAHFKMAAGEHTGMVVALVDEAGERSMFTDRGANLRLQAQMLDPDLLGPGKHLHLSGYDLLDAETRPAAVAALDNAAAAGMTRSVDPSSAGPLAAVGKEAFLSWTEGVDWCCANLDEGRVLAAVDRPEEVVTGLRRHYREVVLTLGADGVLFSGPGHGLLHCPADQATISDTTGAGDAFKGTFLARRLSGDDPEPALRAGLAAAARVVSGPGARRFPLLPADLTPG